jgi:hypothetical protein
LLCDSDSESDSEGPGPSTGRDGHPSRWTLASLRDSDPGGPAFNRALSRCACYYILSSTDSGRRGPGSLSSCQWVSDADSESVSPGRVWGEGGRSVTVPVGLGSWCHSGCKTGSPHSSYYGRPSVPVRHWHLDLSTKLSFNLKLWAPGPPPGPQAATASGSALPVCQGFSFYRDALAAPASEHLSP